MMTNNTQTVHGGHTSLDSALLDVKQVAALLNCSTRHVFRLTEAGKMPVPQKLNTLVRWNRTQVMGWIENGCQPVESVNGKEESGK